MLPSPYGCGLDPRGSSFSRPQCVHCCYGPVTCNPPWGGLVDRLRRFCFHLLRYPNYGALTSTPTGLSPAEHASLTWTHLQTRNRHKPKNHLTEKLPYKSPTNRARRVPPEGRRLSDASVRTGQEWPCRQVAAFHPAVPYGVRVRRMPEPPRRSPDR